MFNLCQYFRYTRERQDIDKINEDITLIAEIKVKCKNENFKYGNN